MTRYTDNNDGTITDNETGLMWEQGEGPTLSWHEAIERCRDMNLGGHVDWRLPTIKESLTIVEYDHQRPVCDPMIGGASDSYWSSTTCRFTPHNAWGVYFNAGYVYALDKSTGYRVRAVRGPINPGSGTKVDAPEKPTPICGTCHYYDNSKCRRWPPRWIANSLSDAGWDWPAVSGTPDWCGEWRKK